MANFLSASFDTGGLSEVLQRFESEFVQKLVYTGAAAAARVIYDEVRLNTSGSRPGTPKMVTATLHNNIYMTKIPEESNETRAVYLVSFRKGSKQAKHGYLVEFGHAMPYRVVMLKNGDWITLKSQPLTPPRRVKPFPFLRPAFEGHMPRAINTGLASMTVRFAREIFK